MKEEKCKEETFLRGGNKPLACFHYNGVLSKTEVVRQRGRNTCSNIYAQYIYRESDWETRRGRSYFGSVLNDWRCSDSLQYKPPLGVEACVSSGLQESA